MVCAAVAFLAGAVGLLATGEFLTARSLSMALPLVGDVKLSSVLLFDVGVYLVVLGLVATATIRLGGEARR